MRYAQRRFLLSLTIFGGAGVLGWAAGAWIGEPIFGVTAGILGALAIADSRRGAAMAQTRALLRGRTRRLETRLAQIERQAVAAANIADQLANILHDHADGAAREMVEAQDNIRDLQAAVAALRDPEAQGELVAEPRPQTPPEAPLEAPKEAPPSPVLAVPAPTPAPRDPEPEFDPEPEPIPAPRRREPAVPRLGGAKAEEAPAQAPALGGANANMRGAPAFDPQISAAFRPGDRAPGIYFVRQRPVEGETELASDHRLLRRLPTLARGLVNRAPGADIVMVVGADAASDAAFAKTFIEMLEKQPLLKRRLRIGIDAWTFFADPAATRLAATLRPFGPRVALMGCHDAYARLSDIGRSVVSHVVADPMRLLTALERGGLSVVGFIEALEKRGAALTAEGVDIPEALAAAETLQATYLSGALAGGEVEETVAA